MWILFENVVLIQFGNVLLLPWFTQSCFLIVCNVKFIIIDIVVCLTLFSTLTIPYFLHRFVIVIIIFIFISLFHGYDILHYKLLKCIHFTLLCLKQWSEWSLYFYIQCIFVKGWLLSGDTWEVTLIYYYFFHILVRILTNEIISSFQMHMLRTMISTRKT